MQLDIFLHEMPRDKVARVDASAPVLVTSNAAVVSPPAILNKPR